MTEQLPVAAHERRLPRYTSYPTAPHFHLGIGADTYRRWLEAVPPSTPVSLYLHVPFCAAMCWYCGCHTTVAKSYAPIAGYAALLAREIELVAAFLPARLPVSHIHWGGGTPNLLSSDDLRRLAAVIDTHFDHSAETEMAVEIDPRTLARDTVSTFAQIGINRASLGVQDFDPRVQEAVNREQSYAMTAEAVAMLRAKGIARLNLDLMYGLPFQTATGVVDTVAKAVALAADRLALFGYAHVPWMKPHQRRIEEAALPDGAARLAQYAAASEAIVAEGYRAIGIDHFAWPDDALAQAAATGRLRRNFQGYTTDNAPLLLAFGASAIGQLPQGYVQNDASLAGWRRRIAAGELATQRGIALGDEDRLRRTVIERLMCDLAVDLARECAGANADPATFASELAAVDALAGRGIGWRRGFHLGVEEKDRALVRLLCACFDAYLPHSEARHSRVV
ncbi:MAG TPA: oxygen-independent coproporphyrinogen III oxidase [Stellaceae bacterium]|nr:oxygen-independent coproporphyrinogen III oxidase [Stellaceae bacterium]